MSAYNFNCITHVPSSDEAGLHELSPRGFDIDSKVIQRALPCRIRRPAFCILFRQVYRSAIDEQRGGRYFLAKGVSDAGLHDDETTYSSGEKYSWGGKLHSE